MDMDRPTAKVSDGSVRKQVATDLHLGDDICPECGDPIGETDSRRVYQVRGGLMHVGHKGCADRYEAGEPAPVPPPPPPPLGARNIAFADFLALQKFVIMRGAPFPPEVRVSVGTTVLQEGQL